MLPDLPGTRRERPGPGRCAARGGADRKAVVTVPDPGLAYRPAPELGLRLAHAKAQTAATWARTMELRQQLKPEDEMPVIPEPPGGGTVPVVWYRARADLRQVH